VLRVLVVVAERLEVMVVGLVVGVLGDLEVMVVLKLERSTIFLARHNLLTF